MGLINNFILKPLMLKNFSNTFVNNVISEEKKNNVIIRKVKKTDLVQEIFDRLVPQNNITKQSKFDKLISSINSGNCILFIDTLNIAFDIDVKGYKQRSVSSPTNEIVIKGPQEAFVENIRTNTSLLRRIVNNEKLVIEKVEIGSVTKTKCALCYISDIVNDNLVSEVRYRLNNLEIDSMLSSRAA